MTSRNASPDDFDRLMRQWMDSDARVGEPEQLLETVLGRTSRTRRIPSWLLVERWVPTTLLTRASAAPRLSLVILLIALLIAAAVALSIGSGRRLPPPFGPAANGLIAFDTNAQIFVSNSDGSGTRLLVEDVANAAAATFSPDGTRLAFWGEHAPDSLYIVNVDGSGLRKVGTDLWISTDKPPSWSPDSRFIVFSSETGPDRLDEGLYVVDAEVGEPRRIDAIAGIRALLPSWSPDGSWIAFVGIPTAGDSGNQLWVIRPDGLDAQRLPTSDDVDLAQPDWAPGIDPLRIVYAAAPDRFPANDIFVVDVDEGVETRISDTSDNERWPAWSPDGTEFAWLRIGQPVAIQIASADGRPIATWPSSALVGPLSWSPDGRSLLATDATRASVSVVSVDGSQPIVRIPHASSQSWPDWQRLAP